VKTEFIGICGFRGNRVGGGPEAGQDLGFEKLLESEFGEEVAE
jgi:hypothetical protein